MQEYFTIPDPSGVLGRSKNHDCSRLLIKAFAATRSCAMLGKPPAITSLLEGEGAQEQGERGQQGLDHLSPYYALHLSEAYSP